MSVIGITMVHNNADIIRATTEHMIGQVDHVIALDNFSTDGAREILDSLPITVIDDDEPGYYQSKKMTNLAKVARNMGAEWVIPFDSDEFWYSPFGTIKEILSEVHSQWLVVTADLYDHVTSTDDDMSEPNPIKRIGWRRSYKGLLPKVACRWREDLIIEAGNHGATYDGGPSRHTSRLVVRHYPYRSHQQFIQKVKDGVHAYANTTGLPESSGAHWKDYGRLMEAHGEETLVEVYDTWFHLNNPTSLPDVVYDPAPIVV